MLIAVVGFVAATAGIVLVAPRMARVADRLATVTGLRGALFGVVFLAIATDLPELTLAPAAVIGGTPQIAIGGLLGSAAAQLGLIAVVDVSLRHQVLLRGTPTIAIVAQCGGMAAVLAVPLLVAPVEATWSGIGIGTLLMPVTYVGMLAALRRLPKEDDPTAEARTEHQAARPRTLWLRFGGAALLLGAAGIVLESATETIGSAIGLNQAAAGALLAGVATSLPEVVTATAAARAGALALGVGNLIGSSALDVALLSVADLFHREGTLFALLGTPGYALVGVSLALTALVVIGLARRAQVAKAQVAAVSYVMVAVYVAGAVILATGAGTT